MKFSSFGFFKKREAKSESRKPKAGGDDSIANEINGLIILSLGFLLFLAILSYHKGDLTYANMGEGNEYNVKNWLGIVGSSVAQPFFEYTFGYAALIFPVLLMILGVFMMLDTATVKTRMPSISMIGIGWAYFIAILLAAPQAYRTFGGILGQTRDYFPSGAIGGLTADILTIYLGRFALVFLTVIFLLILLMLTFQIRLSVVPLYVVRKVQRLLEIIGQAFLNMIAWFKQVQWFPERKPKPPRESLFANLIERDEEEEQLRKPAPPASEAAVVHSISDFDDVGIDDEPSPEIPSHHSAYDETAPPPMSDEAEFEETGFNELDPPVGTEYRMPQEAPPTGGIPESLIPPEDPPGPASGFPDDDEDELVIELPDEDDFDYDEAVKAAMRTYQMPPVDILNEDETENKVSREELMANADLLENTLAQFNVKAFVKKVIEGPVITLYAVRPAEGVKINQVVSLADDLALAMRAKGIRMIAPIPGEAAIGIEIPNRRPSTVYFKSIVRSEKFTQHNGQLSLGMGKTIGGEVFCADLARMPHLLIAGATGAGKSVGINTLIASILYRVPPSDVKFVMIDPKKLELTLYAKLKEHYLAICPELDEIVITHPQNAVLVLRSVVNEMEERYDTLARLGVRDIVSYNRKIEKFESSGEKEKGMRRLPYIVVIIDELADLILTASREVEEPITRLAQMARAVGIHLIVATQRPSVDILTGLIKANFPTRIAYQVATRPDSKVILDMYGAEKLIGNGDMLFLPPGTGKPVRLQNPFISTEEVEEMIKHIRKQPKFPPYELKLVRDRGTVGAEATKKVQQDDLFDKAREIVIRHQQGSVSLLQRKLKIGYARAGRLMDALEEAGVVGPGQGSKAREVLVSTYSDE
ncbi:MAG: DNA translocase FtsK [Calditrichaeota bacterium]|nr:DNA translocase FtsK [Calditrichota bacterium]MCB9088895.1 DNA translocase FtsK [Calditrichia bacterium]